MKYLITSCLFLCAAQAASAITVCENAQYSVQVHAYGFYVSGPSLGMPYVGRAQVTPTGIYYHARAFTDIPSKQTAILEITQSHGELTFPDGVSVQLECR